MATSASLGPPGRIENVVFDLGGVLLTWDPDAILASLFGESDVRASLRRAVFEHPDWQDLDRGSLSEDIAVRRFVDRTGRPVGEIEALMEKTMTSLDPMPESVALLEELSAAGIGLYCLSNMRARSFGYVRERHDFLGRFKGILVSSEVGLLKPERQIFDCLVDRFNLAREVTVFVDDSLPNVEGARRAGLHAIHFRSAAACRRELRGFAW